MTSNFKFTLLSSVAAAAVTVMAAGTASATNGMLPHCVGTAKCGMGGAGSAVARSAVDAAAQNPALAARMGNAYQVNLGWFWADVKGNSAQDGDLLTESSSADSFPNGSFGVNYVIDADTAFNISVVPGGGGASKWPTSRTTNFGGTGNDQEVTYEMMYVQPSYAKKMGAATYGVGGILSRATMKTDSAQGTFLGSGVEDNKETFYGVGFQVGGVWDIAQGGSFALNLRSPVWHQDTGVYDGVVFNDPIDTPMQVQAGIAFDITDQTMVAADVKWVNWSGPNTIGTQPNVSCTACRGFGWDDQIIVMLGVEHDISDALTLRAGFNHGNSPIGSGHVLANYLFPAIVETHYTVGASYNVGNGMELGASAYYAPEKSMTDDGSLFGANATGNGGTTLSHSQKGFQLSFSNDF